MRVPKSAPLPWKLSGREWQVLMLWIELGRLKAVARELGLSQKTVESHAMKARNKIKPTGTTVQALLAFDRVMRNQA